MTKYQAERVNKELRWIEEHGYNTNELTNINHALEMLNKDLHKRGRSDRFTSQKMNHDTNEIYNNLAESLLSEVDRIKSALKSDDFMKHEISEQDYLDYLDTKEDVINHSLADLLINSDQIGDIYKIIRSKGLKKGEYEHLIQQQIDNEMVRGYAEFGYRTVNPDRLSRFIRDSLYDLN